ncbi:MAG: acetate--CoA ligase family protein [Thermodesulfobacteriota bacterium]
MLDCFFNPQSVALVGASLNTEKLSSVIYESLRARFSGALYLVNPAHEELGGIRCYPSINAIKERVDLAVFALSAEHIPQMIHDSAGLFTGAIVVSGGFKEAGPAGAELEAELREYARSSGIRIIGPNCLGIFDTVTGLDTFFIPPIRMERPRSGGLSILSQSGSFAVTVMDELAAEGVGVARVISYGNKADVNESDCLDFLAADEATSAVVLYIESVEEGERFVNAASRCVLNKPVAALKVGHSAPAAAAARSHTGAMAGRYEIYSAAFKKAGVIELQGYEDFLLACKVLGDKTDISHGRRVMIITDGGGIGVSIADSCVDLGLEVPPLHESIARKLHGSLPPVCAISNPMDLTGSVTDRDFGEAMLKTMDGESYDIAIVASLWGPPGLTDNLPALIADKKKYLKKPVIICTPGGTYTRKRRELFRVLGLPVFFTPESAARAVSFIAEGGKDRWS